MSKSVMVIGDANVDLMIRLPDTANKSRDLTQSVPQLFGGGTAANTSVGLARLGVPVMFVGSVGDDGFGRWVAADLAQEGVDTRGLVMLKEAFTPQVIAMIQPDGERHLVVFPPTGGADQMLAIHHVDPSLIQQAGWLHTTGMIMRHAPTSQTVLDVMRMAKAAGITTSIDLNLRIELWGYADVLKANLEQAIALADYVFGNGEEEIAPVAGGGDVEQAARRLSDGQRVIVARLGAQGALAVDQYGQATHVPAMPVQVMDTLGAGDAFNAGFIAARLDGMGIADALAWGHQVAAHKIAHGGARALPTRDQLKMR